MDLHFFALPGDRPTRYHVDIVRHDIGGATVMVTDLTGNPGVPATYVIEELINHLRWTYLSDLAPESPRWIAHIPAQGARPAAFYELILAQDGTHRFQGVRWRRLTPDEIRQLGYEPDEVEMVAGELQRRGIAVAHEGGDVNVGGHPFSRRELRILIHAAHGNVDELLKGLAKLPRIQETLP